MNVDSRNECESFYARIEEFFLQRKYTDVHIICTDLATFYCHQVVLAAASEHLRKLFDRNPNGSVPLEVHLNPNIPGNTFKLILLYMYSGKVTFVDDKTVYHVLVASDILQLETIKERCHHYLSQKGVPERCAVPLLLYAFENDQRSLQATVCRYLLQSKESNLDLRSLTATQLGVLMSYFWPTSHIDEEIMLEKILQWSLPWNPTAETREEVKTLFMNAAKICRFKYLTPHYAKQYFEKMIADTRERIKLRDGAMWNAFHDNDYRKRFVLHMLSRSDETTVKFTTLTKQGGTWDSRPLKPLAGMESVREIRCAVIRDRVYWMQSLALGTPSSNDSKVSFHVSSSVDLTVSIQLADCVTQLRAPDSWHMCSDGQSNIFTCISNSNSVKLYDCAVPLWSQLKTKVGFSPRAMIWYDNKLYLFGGNATGNSAFGVLDVRSGIFNILTTFNAPCYTTSLESCVHRERVYFANTESVSSNVVIFDPVAGKLLTALNSKNPSRDRVCRLASFQDTLLTFFCDNNRTTRVGTIDPYSLTWNSLPENGVFTNEDLLDVVVFTPH